jgi:hypothetical protein
LSLLNLMLAVALPGTQQHAVSLHAKSIGSNGRRQACDSSCLVHAAARALGARKSSRQWHVSQFQRTDSGTVITLTIPPRGRVVTVGGGGTVLVGTAGKARILERFR